MFEVFKAIMQRQRALIDPSAGLWSPFLPSSSPMAMASTDGTVGTTNRGNALNIVTPGKSNHSDTLFPAIPRLRLPQKLTKPLSKSILERYTPKREGSADIPDIPTRPNLPPLSTPQPVTYNAYRAPYSSHTLQVGE